MKKTRTYVHYKDWQSYLDFEKEHDELECHAITNGLSLRGRVPGEIHEQEGSEDRFEHHEISESIDFHKDLWDGEIKTVTSGNPDEESEEEKEQDDFYGI